MGRYLHIESVSAAPLPEMKVIAMSSASRSAGSDREQPGTLDLSAASRWAWGMPLSYVLEVADRWLNRHEHAAPTDPLLDPAFSRTGNPTADTK